MDTTVLLGVVAGVAAGLIGGLLGLGGGIVLMPVLRFVLGFSPPLAAGTCIVAVFCTTAFGSFRHYRQGHIHIPSILPVIIAGALASVVFSLIFIHMARHPRWLDFGMGVVFSIVALRMIWAGTRSRRGREAFNPDSNKLPGNLKQKVAIGGLAGVLPGLLGIGTGAILVPVFTIVLGAQIKVAIGSSLACFMVNSFISAVIKFAQGFVDLRVAVPLCIGTALGANMGARLNRRFPPAALKVLFGLVFLFVAGKFMYIALKAGL